jgi:dipeptidyl aminopeptidase/acylaminoacyl peptidase
MNPRGSIGYGQQFSVDIRADWGNLDYRDIMNGVDYAVEEFDFIDDERLGVMGGSYGGWMTNWIIAHEPDTFRAAVSSVTFANKLSSFGTSDSHYRRTDDFGGPPWKLPEKYRQQSPLFYLEGCTTPTLVMCAENDYRCPIEQGEQLYTALKLLDVPTRFVRFPDESHSFSRIGQPWHRVFRYDQMLEWFEEYL